MFNTTKQTNYRNVNECDVLAASLGLGLSLIVWAYLLLMVKSLLSWCNDEINLNDMRKSLKKLESDNRTLQDENDEIREDLDMARSSFARYKNSALRFLQTLPDTDTDSD